MKKIKFVCALVTFALIMPLLINNAFATSGNGTKVNKKEIETQKDRNRYTQQQYNKNGKYNGEVKKEKTMQKRELTKEEMEKKQEKEKEMKKAKEKRAKEAEKRKKEQKKEKEKRMKDKKDNKYGKSEEHRQDEFGRSHKKENVGKQPKKASGKPNMQKPKNNKQNNQTDLRKRGEYYKK